MIVDRHSSSPGHVGNLSRAGMAGVAASWTMAATIGALAGFCSLGLDASYACHDSVSFVVIRNVDVTKLRGSWFFNL